MSVTGKSGIGIPIILLHDAEGAIITVELKDGTQFRGLLDEAQDNMNLTLKNSIKIAPDGKQSNIDIAYVRGANVSFIVLPEMLKQAPFFNRIKMWRKFKGHAVVGAGGVIGPRGKLVVETNQSKKGITPLNSNSLLRAPPFGQMGFPRPGMPGMPMSMPGMPMSMPGMPMPGMPMPGMPPNQYMQQPPRGYPPNPYGAPPPR